MLRKLWLPLALAGAAWWWTRSPGAEASVEDEVRMIALSGAPLEAAMEAGRCGEMLDEVTSRPDWTLGVTVEEGGCEGVYRVVLYEIHADGTVLYTADGLTRTLDLTWYEQDGIRGLGGLDCTTPVVEELHHYDWSITRIAPGTPVEGDAMLVTDSAFERRLRAILEGAVERRHAERLAELAPIELHVRSGRYRLSLEGNDLRVHRGRRLFEEHRLWGHQLVDLIDYVVDSPRPEPVHGDDTTSGTLTAGGRSYPISLAVRSGEWDPGPLGPLSRVLVDVLERE
jgi:hypothetical protein